MTLMAYFLVVGSRMESMAHLQSQHNSDATFIESQMLALQRGKEVTRGLTGAKALRPSIKRGKCAEMTVAEGQTTVDLLQKQWLLHDKR